MESEDRLAETAWVNKLGPEAETLFTRGSEPEPYVRSDVVDPLVSLLRGGQNIALIGPVGVGKRSLALSLRRSQAWSADDRPTLPFDAPAAHPESWPVYCTTVRNWIAGSFYVGNLENRIDMMLRRVRKPAVILFESVHTAIGAWQGARDAQDLVDLLVSVCTHPRLRMVVTATPEGWAQLRERKGDFAAQFTVVEPAPPTDMESRVITALELTRRRVDVATADRAVAEVFALAARHFPLEHPLGPALRLLRGALARPGGDAGLPALRAACAAQLGLRRCWVGRDFVPEAATVLAELERTVLGQHDACAAVVDDVIAASYGLGSPGRPRSYVFAGPPGIGKTSLACALQEQLGRPGTLPLRFDCSELVSPGDALRLLSTDEPGSLVVGLAERPGAVVLFDEVDRAHPFVRGLLYQLLEGRVTTLQGTTVSTANATVVMTTNAGAEAWTAPKGAPGVRGPGRRTRRPGPGAPGEAGGGDAAADGGGAAADGGGAGAAWADQARAATLRACAEVLGDAIASRVTRMLVFPPLAADDGRAIVELELERFGARPDLRERGVSVSATPRLVRELTRTCVSSRSGARGVQKAVYVAVAVPVARLINEQDVRRSTLVVDALSDAPELEGVRIAIERWN